MWTNNFQIAIFVQLVGILVLIVDKNNLTWTKMSVCGQKMALCGQHMNPITLLITPVYLDL